MVAPPLQLLSSRHATFEPFAGQGGPDALIRRTRLGYRRPAEFSHSIAAAFCIASGGGQEMAGTLSRIPENESVVHGFHQN
jgi:hypothetical protein